MLTKTFFLPGLILCGLSFPVLAQQGLAGEYFDGQYFDHKVLTRTDPEINFVWDNVAPAPGMNPGSFSIRWTGRIKAPESGDYVFRAHVDDGVRVRIGAQWVINEWGMNDSKGTVGEIHLNGGQYYDLLVEYFNGLLEGEIQLFWQLPSEKPTFGGLLGYNDHPINGRFFSLPASSKPAPVKNAAPVAKPGKPAPKVSAPPKPTPKPAASPLKTAQINKDTLERYIPKNILFEKSKPIILPESEPELDRLADFLRRNPRYSLSIEGHTDHIGNAEKNQWLSEQRAQTVAQFLSQKGIDAHRITTKGYGDTRPLIREAAGVPNAKNRRVEFIILE